MYNRRIIRYAVDRDSGEVVSRVGREFAWPILDFEAIGKNGDFTAPFEYNLEKIDGPEAHYAARSLFYTRHVPTVVKNLHRAFWGMAPVAEPPGEAESLERYWKRHERAVFGA